MHRNECAQDLGKGYPSPRMIKVNTPPHLLWTLNLNGGTFITCTGIYTPVSAFPGLRLELRDIQPHFVLQNCRYPNKCNFRVLRRIGLIQCIRALSRAVLCKDCSVCSYVSLSLWLRMSFAQNLFTHPFIQLIFIVHLLWATEQQHLLFCALLAYFLQIQ